MCILILIAAVLLVSSPAFHAVVCAWNEAGKQNAAEHRPLEHARRSGAY